MHKVSYRNPENAPFSNKLLFEVVPTTYNKLFKWLDKIGGILEKEMNKSYGSEIGQVKFKPNLNDFELINNSYNA